MVARCSAKKIFQKFHKIHREILVPQSHFNTVKCLQGVSLATFFKKDARTGVSELAVCRCSSNQVLLNNSQNSQEHIYVGVSSEIKFRSRHSQMFFKIIVLKKFASF